MNDYSIDNLNNKILFDELINKIDKIEFHNDVNSAFKLLRNLEKAVKNDKKKVELNFRNEYELIILKLKFILFISLSDHEILELFGKYLSIGIKMAYLDILEKLKLKISFMPILDRDSYKRHIANIILDNNEEITDESIIIDNKKARPTISNWLKDYNKYLGTGLKSNLEQGNYFINNKNFSQLEELEKLEIKELFNIYEYLKKSSNNLDGNEDNAVVRDIDGKIYILQNNKFIDVKRETTRQTKKIDGPPKTEEEKKIEELKQEEERFDDGGLEQLAIEEEIGKKKRLESMKIEANKYTKGSLERMAVEEEIRKLN